VNAKLNRRNFLKRSLATSGGWTLGTLTGSSASAAEKNPLFKISLAEWSLHKALFAKELDHLDFPKSAVRDYGINAIELVNQFFMDEAKNQKYLAEFKQRAGDHGVSIKLIMCDAEGALGDPDPAKRRKAVENHYKWAEAAKFFGCHSLRVNAETHGAGSFEEQQDRAADGLRHLAEFGAKLGLNVIVENHGHLSSNGQWLAGVMKKVNLPNCGTLPDFGNFDLGDGKQYDRYKGVSELMPFAKAVSAKSHDFDAQGNCVETDYRRMMMVVLRAGYREYVGIEYEGEKIGEPEGIRLTKKLLEKVRDELASQDLTG